MPLERQPRPVTTLERRLRYSRRGRGEAPREESHELRQDLLRRLRAHAPDGAADVRVGLIAEASRCPRIAIQLPGDASTKPEGWAATMRRLFGTPRVRIEYLELNYLDSDGA